MSWVSLEEAEPIPDIHWGIRVLHPPPDQENVQYGELGQWQLNTFSSSQHTASVVILPSSHCRLSRISSKFFSDLMVTGSSIQRSGYLLWLSAPGPASPYHLW